MAQKIAELQVLVPERRKTGAPINLMVNIPTSGLDQLKVAKIGCVQEKSRVGMINHYEHFLVELNIPVNH